MTDTINNQIPFLPENAIDPAAGLNLSLNTVDALLQVLVQTVGANTPPGSPANGARYIVGSAPTGAWAGQANKLTRRLDGAWQFFDVRYVLNAADGLWYVRSASTWSQLAGGGGGEANTASNLGAGEGLYASKVGVDLRFKSLVEGANVTLTSDGDTVTINAAGGGGGSGTVTSVGFTAPTGFDVAGSPVTTAGTLALSFSAGYSLPADTAQGNWNTAFSWGNHAAAGYEKQLTAGSNITIDRTDPDNPIISSTAAGGGGGAVDSVNGKTGAVIVSAPIIVACSDETTALTTGTAKVTFRMPYAITLIAVRASLTTAQASGSLLTVDINEGGATILSTKLTIDNTEKTSTTAATAAVISDTALADDAEITIDIDQVGDGTAKGLKVTLIGYQP